MNGKKLYRPAWVKWGLVALLAACGGAAGLYLSGEWSAGSSPRGDRDSEQAAQVQPLTQRFALSSFDAKDTQEAPELAADASGRMFLTWASKTREKACSIFFTRTADGGKTFASPTLISTGGIFRSQSKRKGGGFERRATPHLGVAGNKIVLAWSGADPNGTQIQMLLAESSDGGSSFSEPQAVHASKANATFTALAVGPSGETACSWLGGPSGSQQVFATLRRSPTATFEPEQLVYAGEDGMGVCPCCATGVSIAPDGSVLVGFRNMDNGYRDIAIARLRRGQAKFDGPFPVTRDTWKFSGCPHDGPSLAAVGNVVHVVWMDAHTGVPRCYHAWASLTDLKFTAAPLPAAGPGSQGNARLFADKRGAVHVVWEEGLSAEPQEHADHKNADHRHGPPKLGSGSGRAIHYAYLALGESAFGPARAIVPVPGAFQTRPAVTAGPDGSIWVAFNELTDTGKSVVVTRLVQPAHAGVNR